MARKGLSFSTSSSALNNKKTDMDMDVDQNPEGMMAPQKIDDKELQLQLFIDQFWKPIDEVLEKLFSLPSSELLAWFDGDKYVKAYTQVYLCCVTPVVIKLDSDMEISEYFHGRQIYKRLGQFLECKLGLLCERLVSSKSEDLIISYMECWKNFGAFANQVTKIFNYVDRHWINIVNANHKRTLPVSPTDQGKEREPGTIKSEFDNLLVSPVATLQMQLWHQLVFIPLQETLINSALSRLNQLRVSKSAIRNESALLLNAFFNSIVTMSLHLKSLPKQQLFVNLLLKEYQSDLESFLKTALALSQSTNAPLDIPKLHAALDNVWGGEMSRLQNFFLIDPSKPVRDEIEQFLVKPLKRTLREQFLEHIPMDPLISDIYSFLWQSQQTPNALEAQNVLRLYYRMSLSYNTLYQKANVLFKEAFEKHVSLFLSSDPGSFQFMDHVFQCVLQAHNLIATIFDEDKKWTEARDQVLRAIFDTRKSPLIVQSLVQRLDQALRPTISDIEKGDEDLKALLTLFKFVDDKDMFRAHYGQLMAKRLLTRNFDPKREQYAISSMHEECGKGYVDAFKCMLEDLQITSAEDRSRLDLDESLRTYYSYCQQGFEVTILRPRTWPISNVLSEGADEPKMEWPNELVILTKAVSRSFLERNQEKKLRWLPDLSKVIVEFSSNSISKAASIKVQLNVYQYILTKILLENGPIALSEAGKMFHTSSSDKLKACIQPMLGHLLFIDANDQLTFKLEPSIFELVRGDMVDLSEIGEPSTTAFNKRNLENEDIYDNLGIKTSSLGSLQLGDFTLWIQSQISRWLKTAYNQNQKGLPKTQLIDKLRQENAEIQLADIEQQLKVLADRLIVKLDPQTAIVTYVP